MTDDLILNNTKLINYTIYKLGLKKDLENCYDVGLRGLVIAGNTYDIKVGCEFSTYAMACIKYELIKYINSEKCHKRRSNFNTVSLYKKININSDGDPLTLIEMLSDGTNLEEDIIKKEKIELLKTIISILEPKDKFMMEHYFELWGNEKMEQKEIAKVLGVKQGYVSYRIKRSMKIIKKIMEEKY